MLTEKQRKQRREYYARNKKKILTYAKRYRKKNKEKVRGWVRTARRKYYYRHRTKEIECSRQYQKTHPEKTKEWNRKAGRKWYSNPENKSKKLKYQLAHREEISIKAKLRYRKKKILTEEK